MAHVPAACLPTCHVLIMATGPLGGVSRMIGYSRASPDGQSASADVRAARTVGTWRSSRPPWAGVPLGALVLLHRLALLCSVGLRGDG